MSLNGDLENYCTECDWTASTGDYERDKLAGLAIEHAVETGHDIESLQSSVSEQEPSRAEID